MKKKKSFLLLALAASSILCVSTIIFSNNIRFAFLDAAEKNYGINFNSSHNKLFSETSYTDYNGQSFVKTNNGNDIEFSYNKVAGGSNSSWHLIKSGGSFYNLDPIHGLEYIAVNCIETGRNYRISWGFDLSFNLGNSVVSSSTTDLICDFDDDYPSFFKFENISEDDISIKSMSISLDCVNYYPVLTLTSSDEAKGTVSGGGVKNAGESVTITATPNSNYSFAGWYNGSSLVSTNNPYTFSMPDSDLELRAEFLLGENLYLDANFDSDAVQVSGGNIYEPNTNVTISASAINDLVFDGWYDDDYNLISNSNPYTFEFTQTMHLVAYYHYSSFSFAFNNVDASLKTCTLSGYTGTLISDLFIPRLYEGNSVTTIGKSALSSCASIVSVDIPNTIILIEGYAFYKCSSLTSVTIPNSVTSIENQAFYKCTSLASVTIPDSVISTGEYIFGSCTSLASVETSIVGYGMFSDCTALTLVTFGTNTLEIEDYAFYKCSSLPLIVIPNKVTTIGQHAFYLCTSLELVSIGNKVTTIKGYAFEGCFSLASITIPYGVTTIEDNAFSNCSSLPSIIIPNSVTSLGSRAFQWCTSATSLNIGSGLSSIGSYTFSNCTSLTSIEIPNAIHSIGEGAFKGCSSVNRVNLGSGVTTIGEQAFYECSSLSSIFLPSNVVSIGESAFSGCYKLVEVINKTSLNIVVDSTNHGSVARYAEQVITDMSDSKLQQDGNGFIAYGVEHNIRLVNYVGSNTSITIPNYVTSIRNYAFYNCSSLLSVSISDSVTSIEYAAFYGCSSLTTVIIPASVTAIGSGAFSDCSSLTIYCEAASQPAGWNSKWNPSNRPVVWGYHA